MRRTFQAAVFWLAIGQGSVAYGTGGNLPPPARKTCYEMLRF